MKRELITIAVSAMLLAGCGTIPSAKNGKHPPADVADSFVHPHNLDHPAGAIVAQGATGSRGVPGSP